MDIRNKKLYRSSENKVIFGVLGGLGEYFDVDPVLLRVIYIVFSAFTWVVPGVIGYVFMAVVMPERAKIVNEKNEVKREEQKENAE